MGQEHNPSLLDALGGASPEHFEDAAWVEVVQKMDEVYSDLIRYEVDLEEKNARLEEAQQFISSVLSSMSDILIVCDPKRRVQEVNQATLELTGFAVDKIVGKPMEDLLKATDDDERSLCARLQAGEMVQDCETTLKKADGSRTDTVAMNCSPRFDHDGRPAGMVMIGRPVGELKRAYEALNQAHAELQTAQKQLVHQEKMASIGRLVAGVAHELNNPISFIYGNLYALKKYGDRFDQYLTALHGGASESELAVLREELRIDKIAADMPSLLDGTMEGAQRLSDIIKNLRRLSFTETEEAGAVDLARIIRTAIQWTVKGAKAVPDIAVKMPEEVLVRGHEGPIHQVVTNLIQNALDAVAGQDGAAVRVTVEDGDGEAKVSVADTGPGIAEKDQLKVFDPFFTTKSVGEGTGLGLWISYGIVRDHGGVMEAANSPDGGAVFSFTLPTR